MVTRVREVKKAIESAAPGNAFATVAADWVKGEARRAKWTPGYREEVTASLRNHLSALDPLPLAEILAKSKARHETKSTCIRAFGRLRVNA
jgi:hypothetical protein